MIIAQEKRKTNIAEYIIYMFQIEDMLRAMQFNNDQIKQFVTRNFAQYQNKIGEIENWYVSLSELMIDERIEKTGHLSFIQSHISELEDFHKKLLAIQEEEKYRELFKSAEPFIKEFSQKADTLFESVIEICLHALYTKLLLKLKGTKITGETENAFNTFSNLLAYFSNKYHGFETGKIEM